MPDLISSLADSIVALINASPRSPTKAEVDEVLREPLTMAMLQSFPLRLYAKAKYQPAIAAEDIKVGDIVMDCQDAALVWINDPAARIFNEPFDKAGAPCPLSNNGAHHYEHLRPVVPPGMNHNDVNLPPDDARMHCACGATKP